MLLNEIRRYTRCFSERRKREDGRGQRTSVVGRHRLQGQNEEFVVRRCHHEDERAQGERKRTEREQKEIVP